MRGDMSVSRYEARYHTWGENCFSPRQTRPSCTARFSPTRLFGHPRPDKQKLFSTIAALSGYQIAEKSLHFR